MMLSGLG